MDHGGPYGKQAFRMYLQVQKQTRGGWTTISTSRDSSEPESKTHGPELSSQWELPTLCTDLGLSPVLEK